MVALPVATPVTTPFWFTVARPVLLDDQVTVRPVRTLPNASRSAAPSPGPPGHPLPGGERVRAPGERLETAYSAALPAFICDLPFCMPPMTSSAVAVWFFTELVHGR